MDRSLFDLVILGGGVNGCGIARDAAGRGMSVFLCERDDLASGTSSASTKLIHGGLRYLEQRQFRLVRESLLEREVLLRAAPHIMRHLRFMLPHHRLLRPLWLLRLGLFLYDHLGGRHLLPPTRIVNLHRDSMGKPLKPAFVRGLEYSDCAVDDARLVVLNAIGAVESGACIRVGTDFETAHWENDAWSIKLRDLRSGRRYEIRAKALVNAAGPWAGELLTQRLQRTQQKSFRLVKGSHIIVRRALDPDRAYTFQQADGRVIFAISYQRDWTLIGTTDVDYRGDPRNARISAEEVEYLCSAVSEYFREPVRAEDVIHAYAGVRALFDENSVTAQEASRDYVLQLDQRDGGVLLNVFGGKLTTYRKLAEAALDQLRRFFPSMGAPWTARVPLPGGQFRPEDIQHQCELAYQRFPRLPHSLLDRLVHAYGTRAPRVLQEATSLEELGICFGADLYEREVRYLVENEWALSAADILWRRSKLGLRTTADEARRLSEWLADHLGVAARPHTPDFQHQAMNI